MRLERVAVIGYGNQGRAHALNLRDSGVDVIVGARPGPGSEQATVDGFHPVAISEAAHSPVVALTLPDETIGTVFTSEVAPSLAERASVILAHGFAWTYGQIALGSGQSCGLVSPCGPGVAVREEYVDGRGVPALLAAEPGSAWPVVEAYAEAIGCARAGLVRTTFREETECDLFGEQTVLVGGLSELVTAAWETLVEAGFQPEVAHSECVAQIGLLARLVSEHGPTGMRERVSDTAEWGALTVGPTVIGSETRQAMREALARVRSGEFARDWLAEAAAGKPRLRALREAAAKHPIERSRP
jgi:ketol-acid reductoisomerase